MLNQIGSIAQELDELHRILVKMSKVKSKLEEPISDLAIELRVPELPYLLFF